MKLTAKKSNGTIIFKEINSSDKDYINYLKKKGWAEVQSSNSKNKTKKSKK